MGKGFESPILSSVSDSKAGELLAKIGFLDFISFFLHFGRQDGFFSVYLEERLFSF